MTETPKSPNPPYGLTPEAWWAVVTLSCCAEGPQTRYGPLTGNGPESMVPVPLSWIVALRDFSREVMVRMNAGKDATWDATLAGR